MRSNGRILGETWDESASWKSSLTDNYTFDFLKGQAVLEATVSDGIQCRSFSHVCSVNILGNKKRSPRSFIKGEFVPNHVH